MKVIAINGSPHDAGNTAQSLKVVAQTLAEKNIDTEIITIGKSKFGGCNACASCRNTGKCVIDDGLNEIAEKIVSADGLIVASPVYYAGMNGELKVFLDRVFYSHGSKMRFKPCAAVAIARRAGTVTTFDEITHYFLIAEMLVTPSTYWTGIFGATPGEVNSDVEGISMLQQIAVNIAHLINLQNGVPLPEKVTKQRFNFIR
jgi:multimeric flavodoxin WrbA